MAHILVVCTANICRSPVAEALLQDRLDKRGLEGWTVRSAGTWAQWERGASRYSIEVMEQQGYDIGSHRARMVDASLVETADLVLCMEMGHAEALRVEFPALADKIFLLSEMVGERYSIPDPYGGPLKAYQQMVAELTKLIDEGLDQIIALVQRNVG
jgi:protein-tyrosine-phosphatase